MILRKVQFIIGFNVHIQKKHTPVMGTHYFYQVGCLTRTVLRKEVHF